MTKRERQVLQLAAGGLTAEESAELLGVGLQTVKTHLQNARYVLAAENTANAVFLALRSKQIY